MTIEAISRGLGSEGQSAPPINGAPRRLQRTRKAYRVCPPGAIYVGRPTIWGNPFERRPRIGHARSVILYRAWVAGDLSPHILRCAWFSDAEITALARWRDDFLARIDRLCGHDLQCWCPLTSPWCHADALLRMVNTSARQWTIQ